MDRCPQLVGAVRCVGNLTGWSVRATLQDGKASVVGVGLAGLPEPELAQVNGSVPAYLTR
jgi:hypothetical protein